MSTAVISILSGKDLTASFFSGRRLTDGLAAAATIVEVVRARGDSAVREYAARFDRANPAAFLIPEAALEEARNTLQVEQADLYAALTLSRDLARSFALRQKESFDNFEITLSPGLTAGQRTIPVERAGVYVPAGRFPLLSSVIMGCVPALAAGVEALLLCTPPAAHPSGNPDLPWADERIMAVAALCGVKQVYAIGGAQAIAAMAYGTESVPRVQVIVGPGNKFVAAAKKLVYGDVGIDMVAGPSEVLIIADDSADPEWVAADLYAQAEHDSDAQAVLITTSAALAEEVQARLTAIVSELPPQAAARSSLAGNSCIIIVDTLDAAVEIANRKAPEHLELALDAGPQRDALEKRVRNFGSLFVGHRAAEVLGDYAGGLNHTLPTSGAAAFTGGLSVRHFLKTVTVLRTAEDQHSGGDESGGDVSGWLSSLRAAALMADAEGLAGHARSARCRLK